MEKQYPMGINVSIDIDAFKADKSIIKKRLSSYFFLKSLNTLIDFIKRTFSCLKNERRNKLYHTITTIIN